MSPAVEARLAEYGLRPQTPEEQRRHDAVLIECRRRQAAGAWLPLPQPARRS